MKKNILAKIKNVLYIITSTLVVALAALIFFDAIDGTLILGGMATISVLVTAFVEIGLFMDNKVENQEGGKLI